MSKTPIKKSGMVYVQSRTLTAPHAYLGRCGGRSALPFSSLNCAFHVGDRIEDVEKNRDTALLNLGFEDCVLITVEQVHGHQVITIAEKKDYRGKKADAIITNLKGTAIGVLTADCVPILLYDAKNKAIGVVHAGRKGTIENVAGKTIYAMQKEFNSNPAKIISSIGPSIGQCCYSVGEDILQEFKKAFGDINEFTKNKNIDLAAANMLQLKKAGIPEKNIALDTICTSCRNDIFFSYRKDGKLTGRQLSFIKLPEGL